MSAEVKTKPTPNKQQQLAIDTYKRKGTFLVLAGPGTGKTFTVSQRIKAIIESGTPAERILCLTFSDAAAKEMRKKLTETLTSIDSNVNIFTFHSFCMELIKDNPDKFDLNEKYNIINDSVSRAIIKECIDDEKLNPQIKAYRDDKNNVYRFIPDIKKGIDEIKKCRLEKEQFFYNLKHNPYFEPRLKELNEELEEKKKNGKKIRKDLVPDIEAINTKIAQMEELWKIYELYIKKTEERNLIDFSDMINMVLKEFQNNQGFLVQTANKYQYIMVDEYQDTNDAQNAIVINLANAQEHKNVFVVGDDDQIIYTFQGASLYTINNFLKKFPETEKICLTENWRSTKEILDTAKIVVQHPDNYGRIPKDDLQSFNHNYDAIQNGIRLLSFDKKENEYAIIVSEIKELTKTYADKLKEIAVLVTSNKEVAEIARLLKNQGVQVQTSGGTDIFKIRSVIVMLLYMEFLVNPYKYENKFFEMLLMKPFSINPKDFELLKALKTNNKVLFEPKMIEEIKKIQNKFIEYDKIKNFLDIYTDLKEITDKETIVDTVLMIGTKTGIFKEYMEGDSKTVENIEGLLKLCDEAAAFTMIEEPCLFIHFVEYLNRNLNDGIEIKTDKPDITYNAVQVLTLHDSKGREFEYVYMPTIERSKWESKNKRTPEIPDNNYNVNETYKEAEERLNLDKLSEVIRLMYVGMTRAKHTLRLSYADLGKTWHTNPSKYITNFEKQTPELDEVENKINSLYKYYYDDISEYNVLIDKYLENIEFSPSSLNLYLSCPKKYLYNYVFKFSSKHDNQDNLNLGLAVHKAYQDTVTDALNNDGKYPDETVFQTLFQDEMQKRIFSERSIQENYMLTWAKYRKEAYNHLTTYPAKDFQPPEYKFTQEIKGENFKCIIDRIPYIDGQYYIHDYKTGKRPETPEKVKTDKPEYYNQLALYKYALEKNQGIKIKDCILIYPLDDKIELPLYLDEQKCEEVIDIYMNAINNIREHKFDANPQNKQKTCNWCPCKEICNYNGGSKK